MSLILFALICCILYLIKNKYIEKGVKVVSLAVFGIVGVLLLIF